MNRVLAATACLLVGSLFAQEYKLGTKVPGFNLEDLSGKPAALSALDGPITVLTFVATQCPVSNAYNERMNAIYKDYSGRGVKFIFVNANRRHYEAGAQALAQADPAWLGRLITRRVPLTSWSQAYQRQPTDVKVVLEFDPGPPA